MLIQVAKYKRLAQTCAHTGAAFARFLKISALKFAYHLKISTSNKKIGTPRNVVMSTLTTFILPLPKTCITTEQ